MHPGAFTSYIDVAQVALYGFWVFFAALLIYLRKEDKREGYPLESDRSPHVTVQGWPAMPAPKVFKLAHGGEVHVSVKDEALAFELTPAPPKLDKKAARKAPPATRKPKAASKPASDADRLTRVT